MTAPSQPRPNPKLAFVGGGNMAAAFLRGLRGHNGEPAAIAVAEPSAPRRAELGKLFPEARVEPAARAAAADADVVVLAVKPQTFAAVAAELGGALRPSQAALSIMAGVELATLSRELKHRNIARAMPNLAVGERAGITVWCAANKADERARANIKRLLNAVGTAIAVEPADERLLDAVTAVGGSGPAYVFRFMAALQESAAELGLPPPLARRVVVEMVAGSAELARASSQPLDELVRSVASRGGTTAAALERLDDAKFNEAVREAVRAAARRSAELKSGG